MDMNPFRFKGRDYWSWTCDCGEDDNRNIDNNCKSCGLKIDCKTAGGHSSFHPFRYNGEGYRICDDCPRIMGGKK